MGKTRIVDGNFRKAARNGPRILSAPFSGDPAAYLWTETMMIQEDAWSPLKLSTPHPENAGYVLCEESAPNHVGCGILSWSRTYARIPDPREDGESFAWRMPGIGFDAIVTVPLIKTAVSSSGVTTITTTENHPFKAGNWVTISYTAIVNGVQIGRNALRKVLSSNDAVFTVDLISEKVVLWNSVRPPTARVPVTRVVASKLAFDYYLVGSKQWPSIESIPIEQIEIVSDADGKETDTYSASTYPSSASYVAKVASRTWIIAESSIIRRWKGQIFERVTRYVRAQ